MKLFIDSKLTRHSKKSLSVIVVLSLCLSSWGAIFNNKSCNEVYASEESDLYCGEENLDCDYLLPDDFSSSEEYYYYIENGKLLERDKEYNNELDVINKDNIEASQNDEPSIPYCPEKIYDGTSYYHENRDTVYSYGDFEFKIYGKYDVNKKMFFPTKNLILTNYSGTESNLVLNNDMLEMNKLVTNEDDKFQIKELAYKFLYKNQVVTSLTLCDSIDYVAEVAFADSTLENFYVNDNSNLCIQPRAFVRTKYEENNFKDKNSLVIESPTGSKYLFCYKVGEGETTLDIANNEDLNSYTYINKYVFDYEENKKIDTIILDDSDTNRLTSQYYPDYIFNSTSVKVVMNQNNEIFASDFEKDKEYVKQYVDVGSDVKTISRDDTKKYTDIYKLENIIKAFNYTPFLIDAINQKMDNYIAILNIPKVTETKDSKVRNMQKYNAAKALYEYMPLIFFYDDNLDKNYYGDGSAILFYKSTCVSISLIYDLMLEKVGFYKDELRIVSPPSHRMNAVYIFEKWYIIDATGRCNPDALVNPVNYVLFGIAYNQYIDWRIQMEMEDTGMMIFYMEKKEDNPLYPMFVDYSPPKDTLAGQFLATSNTVYGDMDFALLKNSTTGRKTPLVSMLDLTKLVKHTAKGEYIDMFAADLNSDGSVNEQDVDCLKRELLKN